MAKSAKKSSRSRSKQAEPRDRVIDALMKLLETRRYAAVSLPDIAESAKVSLAELRGLYDGKAAILADFSRRIDQAVLADGPAEGDNARERLFDIMMRRFDALAPHRSALKRLSQSACSDPALALLLTRISCGAQSWMYAAAGLRSDGIAGMIAYRGSALVFAEAARTWFGDDDPGLAKTMAALDRALTRGDRVMGFVNKAVCFACDLAERGRSRPATG